VIFGTNDFIKGVRYFGGGGASAPTPPPAPKAPPTIDEAAQDSVNADELRRRKGRQATMVTGPLGVSTTPLVATKVLLGE
jgi:hypothetical protein